MVSPPRLRHGAALVALALALPTAALADSPTLAEARQAIKQVKYDRAQARLVDALHEGGHDPAELREILQLAGTTAIVLGQRDIGEQYFRQWLALSPDAALPAGTAPKLREAIVAAQAAMAALGRFEARARVDATGALELEVTHDPLRQASAVAVIAGAAGERRALVAGKAAGPLPVGLTAVQVLDVHGNQLVLIAVEAVEPPPAITPPVITPPVITPPVIIPPGGAGGVGRTEAPLPPPPLARRPRWRTWEAWSIPTTVTAGIGVGFAIAAKAARDERDRLGAEPGGQFSDEYAAAAAAASGRQLGSNLAFVATGVIAAVGAVVVLTWHPPAGVRTALRVDTDGDGGVVQARWWAAGRRDR
jgi:hypothetical protein